MIDQLLTLFINLLNSLGSSLPLPVFVIVGSVLEELISPIPATLVLGVAGSAVKFRDLGLPYLLLLTVLATVGKTAAAWITYWLGRLVGEFLIERWGKFFGVKVGDIHDVNLKLKTKKAWWIMCAMRSLPIAPSASVSIAAGIIRMKQRIFGTATLVGYFLRNLFIAAAGYGGLDFLQNWEKMGDNPAYGVAAAIVITICAVYFVVKYFKKYYPISEPR